MIKSLSQILGVGRIKTDVVLAPYTSLKIGGPAEYYFEALTKDDLLKAHEVSRKHNLKLTMLGGGSNVVVSEKGIGGLVVRNLYREKTIVDEHKDSLIMEVSSGYPMTALVSETAAAGLAGLEYHLGLPGTVGGAVYMNSKWTHPVCYIGDQIVEAELITKDGPVKRVKRDYFQFAYDFSILQKTGEILLTATFKLQKGDPAKILARAQAALAYRKATQPFGIFSSGCFFKNVDGRSAGQLIDELGLKGLAAGNFYVSDKHGNFIIHQGGGKQEDLKKLIGVIKDKAKEKHGLELEEEVIFL